jgi:hypothetical protein
MTERDTWFLLVQHKDLGRTDVRTFTDDAEATSAYNETERRYTDGLGRLAPDVDVLLVGAASLDVVKRRYPSYFMSATTMADKIKFLMEKLPIAG